MISVILVGKNEGWRLTKSLESIYLIIHKNPNYTFEVLYIDSKSTDDSLMRAKTFKNIRIFEITGLANSAIARNVGAKEAKGEILFFIDADMEIEPEYLINALDEKGNLKHDYLTGHINDVLYTDDGKFIEKIPRTYTIAIPKIIQELNHNGGIFLIKKDVWFKTNGMRNKYKRCQDLDFTIRLKGKGIKILRLPHLIANHHTVDYRNEKRMWKMLWSGFGFYPPMIFRDHLLNSDVLKRAVRSDYTALLLLFIFVTFFTNSSGILFSSILYINILFIRVIVHSKKDKSTKNKIFYFFQRYLLQFLLDISFWVGFLFFHPRNKVLQYKKA